MMSDDLRSSYMQRAQALQTSLQHLITEVLAHMPPRGRRDFKKRLGAKIEVLFNDLDRAIHGEDGLEEATDRLLELSDNMINARAEMERVARGRSAAPELDAD